MKQGDEATTTINQAVSIPEEKNEDEDFDSDIEITLSGIKSCKKDI